MVGALAKKDFGSLLEYLRASRIINTDFSPQNLSKLKRIHSVIFSIALWEEKITTVFKKENERVFVSDLKSDIIQSLPLVLLGYKKATALLLRSTIENILRHIYFFDHSVEFEWYKNSGFSLRREEMQNYIQKHPNIGEIINKINLVDLLGSKYTELSVLLHGKRALTEDFATCLRDIRFDQEFYDECFETINLFGHLYNFVLASFHRANMTRFDSPARTFIFSFIPTKEYKILVGRSAFTRT